MRGGSADGLTAVPSIVVTRHPARLCFGFQVSRYALESSVTALPPILLTIPWTIAWTVEQIAPAPVQDMFPAVVPRSATGEPSNGEPTVTSPWIAGAPVWVAIAERDQMPPSECPTSVTTSIRYAWRRKVRKRFSAAPLASSSPVESSHVEAPGEGLAHDGGGLAEPSRTGAVNTLKPARLSAGAMPPEMPQLGPSLPAHAGAGELNGDELASPETRTIARVGGG